MNKYTIYCTDRIVEKAGLLQAPLKHSTVLGRSCFVKNCGFLEKPTAEQMMGWLLDNGITDIVISRKMNPHTFGFNIWYGMNGLIQEKKQYPTRKKATLAAINAALEYLTNKKK